MSTPKQLRERWLTPKWIKARGQILKNIKDKNWEKFLVGFPFVEEVKNDRDLRFVIFLGCNLEGADLRGAYLRKAYLRRANLRGAYLRKANLEKANLWGADLSGADLRKTYLKGAYLRKSNFEGAIIENIKFDDCDLYNVTFKSSKMANVDWGNSKIKREYFKNLKPFENENGFKNYNMLMETYISLKNQFNKLGLYNDMSWAYLKEKESLRFHYKQNSTYKKKYNFLGRTKNFFKCIWEYILFLLFGYGEKPWLILGWSILTIIIFGLIYKIPGGIEATNTNTVITYWRSMYFSAITFTTLGFSDFLPIHDLTRTWVMIEAATGLFFYSLFIFTFGRRIAGR